MAIRLTDVYNKYVERFSDRIANTNFSTIRLRPIYNRYSERFPNRVSGVVDFIPNTYAIGFTPKLQVGSPTQFQINSKSFFDIRSRNIAVTSGVTHTNYNDGSFVKSFNARLYSPEKRYSDSVNLTDINTSPIGKYAITERSKSPLMRQYAKFNLRNDSTGNLEPFILRGIQRNGKNQEPQRWGGGLGAVGIAVIADRAANDLLRLGKFALSSNGIKYGINQGILQVYRLTRPYESKIKITTKPPFFEVKKPGKDFRVSKALGGYNNKRLKDFIPPIPGVGILDTGYTRRGGDGGDISSYKTGARKKLTEIFGRKFEKEINQIVSSDDDYNKNLRKDLIPIGFDRVDGDKVIFRGTVSGISDSMTPSWESYNYIGRPDKVYNYTGLDRNLTFQFEVYAYTKDNLEDVFKKLDFLSKLTMPEIVNNRMSGPIIKLTLGELIRSELGFISSLSITPSTDVPWDLPNIIERKRRLALPRVATVNVGFTFIHNKIPSNSPDFYSYSSKKYFKRSVFQRSLEKAFE